MDDYIEIRLTQAQYERLKNDYDFRVKFKDKHFIEELSCRSMDGSFFRYIGPNQRLKEIARLKEIEHSYKRQVRDLECQIASLRAPR